MEDELASVLADPSFVRSPVLARLLAYLVEATVRGDGGKLKSYAVAVDGLGRSPEVDPQVDTYARVQVARLRKALDQFYGAAGAQREQRLTIDSGSYGVRLVPNEGAAEALPEAAPEPADSPGRTARLTLAIAVLGLVTLAIAWGIHWRDESRAANARWKTGTFPAITVVVRDQGAKSGPSLYADNIRQELLMRIGRYQGLRTNYDTAAASDYAIEVELSPADGALLAKTFVVDRQGNRIVWSTTDRVPIDPGDSYFHNSEYVSRVAFTVGQATGIVHSSERRRNHPNDTPYGCWLRFTMQLQNRHTVDDSELATCAADWHAATPDHPIAAGLHAWSLLDQSLGAATESGRHALIDEAVQTLENARALNPTSGFVPAVAMRAYAFAGEDLALRASVDQALHLNPGNLEVEGLAGTMLVFRNDPRGPALLDHAIARHANPPPWYFVARFVAAMMREDTAGAGQALTRLRQLNHSLPVLPVFTAAYQARTGQVAAARASWAQAQQSRPILRADPDVFFARTALAPAPTARLKRWLAPVLE